MNTQLSIGDAFKHSQLQMAAEAFIRNGSDFHGNGQALEVALVRGNDRNTKFTETQAKAFAETWVVVDQKENTDTGFSGTLFKCIKDDPATGAKKDEYVISFRSTEFLDDAARDNQATNQMEIAKYGFAFGQLRDMEDWYQSLRQDPSKLPAGVTVDVTGYSLGGHLATALNVMHQGDGHVGMVAGIGQWAADSLLTRRTRSAANDSKRCCA